MYFPRSRVTVQYLNINIRCALGMVPPLWTYEDDDYAVRDNWTVISRPGTDACVVTEWREGKDGVIGTHLPWGECWARCLERALSGDKVAQKAMRIVIETNSEYEEYAPVLERL